MLIDLIQNKAWAIHPAKLDEINVFIEARLADPSHSIEVAKGKSGNRAEERYQCIDGVAVLPVYGVIDKRANMFMEASGGTSTELLQRDFRQALDDPNVSAIVLDVDSPGGSVDGTKELSDLIASSRGPKPIVAYANGMMASAAYWIASAADSIVASDTAMVGSIGVSLTHYDRSEADAQAGIKRTFIYAGEYKRIASDEKPLTDSGREYLQTMVDTYYSIFVESVAQNRGIDPEKVLKMANGKEYIGKQAKKVGLVDDIGTLNTAITKAMKGVKPMDRTVLKEKHPELYAEVQQEGLASVDVEKIKAEARHEAIAEERERAIKILLAEGDAAITLRAIQEGTSFESVGWEFFQAEKSKRAQGLKDVSETRPESAGQVAVESGKTDPKGDFDKLVSFYRTENKCGLGTAMSAVAKQHPEIHRAWLDTHQ